MRLDPYPKTWYTTSLHFWNAQELISFFSKLRDEEHTRIIERTDDLESMGA